MHRNAEIWEKRHERLEAVFQAKSAHFGQARGSPAWGEPAEAARDAWRKRYDVLERRVWNALCVAKGWRREGDPVPARDRHETMDPLRHIGRDPL